MAYVPTQAISKKNFYFMSMPKTIWYFEEILVILNF